MSVWEEEYNTNDELMCPNPSTDRQSNGVEILQLEARKITEKEERFFIYFRFLHTGELEH